MEDHDLSGMTDRKWMEMTGQVPPIEAARAAVDRIAAGKSSVEAEIERLGYSHEEVRARVEAERSAAEQLGLSVPKPKVVPIESDIAAVRDALAEAEACCTDDCDIDGRAHVRALRETLEGLLAEQRRGA